jgi:dolichyl-phosphate-mannose-protein mannosyltransferase
MIWYLGRMQRRIFDLSPKDWDQFTFGFKIAGLGWLLHYFPFLIMARVCYIHHYVSYSTYPFMRLDRTEISLSLNPLQLPTLYFAVLMMAHLLDHFIFNESTARYTSRHARSQRVPLSNNVKNAVFVLVSGLVTVVFWLYRETAWGIDGSANKIANLKLRKSWNIVD